MAKSSVKNISVENAKIAFRNFSGEGGRYNREGDRNFCLMLDDEQLVADLVEDGWNIKYLKPREEEDSPQAYLQVKVSYANIPPRIIMITSRGKTVLDESTVGTLDYADITNIDLIVRPYEWAVEDKSGIKAYVKTMYVVLEEDAFEAKYYGMDE